MTESEEEFYAKLFATFRIEAADHLKVISEGLLTLEKEKKAEVLETIFREAHSLKGAARSVDQKNIALVCQSIENVFAAWKQGKIEICPDSFNTLYKAIDDIEKMLTENAGEKGDFSSVIAQLEAIATGEIKKSLSTLEPQLSEKISTLQKSATQKPSSNDKTIRISLQKLDRLFQESEEMLMVKLISKQQAIDLKQLFSQLQKQEREFSKILSETQILKQTTKQGKFVPQTQEAVQKFLGFLEDQQASMKSLGESLNQLTKHSQQNAHIVSTMVDVLLTDIKKVLVQPLSTLFETLPRMIRDLAHQLKKEVIFEFQGGEIEVDRRILEEIKDGIIHLIRNSIDHGIESPEERVKQKKTPAGVIRIIANEISGSNVELSISDDGRGIDTEKMKVALIKKNIVKEKELQGLSNDELIKLAFNAGISTSPIVTELSGRGLGVGIVAEKVDKLDGRMTIETQPHQGTTFKLYLPLTLATFRGIMITISNQDFFIPTQNVKRVLRIKHNEIKSAENCETIQVDEHSISFIHLADLLGLSKKIPEKDQNPHLCVLIVKAAEKVVAIGVDEVHRESEVLLKGLGSQLVRVKNILAATIAESGKVIPILNPTDLIRSTIQGGFAKTCQESGLQSEVTKKRVILAEDSLTTRLLFKNILETAGFDVKAAIDGLEALEILQAQKFDLLLTDVEMPRMDGFTLVEKIRNMPTAKNMPIIICSARGAKEDRERGIETGANAYIDKSSFTQEGLLSIIKNII